MWISLFGYVWGVWYLRGVRSESVRTGGDRWSAGGIKGRPLTIFTPYFLNNVWPCCVGLLSLLHEVIS